MTLPTGNPRPPEGINATETSGLSEFALLATGLGLAGIALAFVLSVAAGWIAPFIPFSWEQTVAGPVAATDTVTHPKARKELQQLANRLAARGGLPPGMRIRVHLSPNKHPNAFATLGGNVIVTRGLLKHVSSENALAMVLAHEIGHVKHRDPLRTLGSVATFQLIWAALTGSSGQSGATRVFGSGGLMTQLKFSRDMEAAADRFALSVLRKTYGSDCGAGEFFRNVYKQHKQPAWSAFASTHPLTSDRLAMIGKATTDHPPVMLTPLPPAIAKLTNSLEQSPGVGCVRDVRNQSPSAIHWDELFSEIHIAGDRRHVG